MALWLCIHLPRLAIETASNDDGIPAAIFEQAGPRRVVICANAAAQAQGIQAGMPETQAQSLLPTLQFISRRAHNEQATLQRLAAWAMQYTSFVHIPGPPPEPGAGRLWLEIGGSLRLFGGESAIVDRITSELAILGYTVQTGVAAQPKAAALRARAPGSDGIEDLPTSLLELPPSTLEVLQASGLRRIGDVLALPRVALGRRFGTECLEYLARLTGETQDPLKAFQPPEHYSARVEFAAEVATNQALRFPLRRLVDELAGSLRGLDAAVLHIALDLEHAEDDPTPIRLRPAQPIRDPEQWLALIEERLARVRLAVPVRALRLSTGRYLAFTPRQGELFETQSHQAEALSHLLDRLRARLGDEAIGYLRTVDEHRPDHASQLALEPDSEPSAQRVTRARRPVWLLDTPPPLTTPPELLAGPERIESGWWQADLRRDYYLAQASDGRRLWIFHDGRKPEHWYLHGLFA